MRRLAVLMVTMLLATPPALGRNREAARKAYGKAAEYHTWLKQLPGSRRSRDRFNRAIYLYRTVVDHDPTYGASDDALFAVATLYQEMAKRFTEDRYERRAIYYFEFVAREYPTTPHRDEAQQRASQLRAPPPTLPAQVAGSDGALATLSEVRYWSNEDSTRVVLQLDREVEFSKQVLRNPDRLYFDLAATRLEKSMEEEYEVNGLFIKQVRVAQNKSDRVRVVLDFEQINNHRVFALFDPYRIVIDTQGQATATGQADTMKTASAVISLEEETNENRAPSSIPSPTRGGDLTMTRVLGLKVARVVIDPGHGGHDTGTIGPNGLKEKNLVLDVSMRLHELLASRLGTEVILTRRTDQFIPLEERTAIANKNGADLFISIHANASRNRKVSGVETYVLSFATNQEEREVALRENVGASRTVAELDDVIRQIARDDYNEESIDLATVVQQHLHGSLKATLPNQRNRGVKRAPFVVLVGSNMPSILSEVGFISNPDDARLFSEEETREQVAEALFQGISEYLKSLGSLAVTEQVAAEQSRPR